MRFHAPLCVLPPCASSLPWGGPHQRPDVIPGQPLQPACVILHASGPAARSFLSPLSPPDADGHIFFTLRQALCALSRFDPSSRHGTPLPHPTPPCGNPARQTDIRLPRGIICPTGSGPPPLPCLPDLPLPVEHTHIAVPCHFASSPDRLPPIKRRGRKAGASLPPVSAAVTAHHKSCPRCT